MDFRLAHRLGALGGQYTVPPCAILSDRCQLLGDVLGDKGSCAMWDGDLFSVATSPDLVLAVAMLSPSMDLGEAFELLVVHNSASIASISSVSTSSDNQEMPSPVMYSPNSSMNRFAHLRYPRFLFSLAWR